MRGEECQRSIRASSKGIAVATGKLSDVAEVEDKNIAMSAQAKREILEKLE